jgi:hypothetical protein
LPPNHLDLEARVLETTLPIPRGARTIRLTERRGKLRIDALAGSIGERARDALTTTVSRMFRFDENLFDFYTLVKEDGELSWCAVGAGRMLRAPTVFEDVVKTICTPIRINAQKAGRRWIGRADPQASPAVSGASRLSVVPAALDAARRDHVSAPAPATAG